MATALGGLRRRILGISPREVTFEARGFPPGDPAARRHLEAIARVFVSGYHIALEESDGATLRARLDSTEPGVRGWAYEGAAMGLALRDHFSPWRRNRLLTFIEEQGSEHIYMLHVGAGWALARLRLA
ncbi:MAG: DUF1702 family protein, partial [Planctomycetota bacterium]